MYNIGIDIGGTTIKAALVSETNEILHQFATPTQNVDGETLINQLESCCHAVNPENLPVNSLGIGCPGWVKNGILKHANNLDNCDETNLAAALQSRLNVPVFTGNDAKVAAIAEWEHRNEKTPMLYLSIGTGIGSAFIDENGKLFSSHNGLNLEIGHIITHANGNPCTCGKLGCFEAHASSISLEKLANQSCKSIYDSAKSGNSEALALVHHQARELAIGISNACLILDSPLVVIGGAVTQSFSLIETQLRETVQSLEYSPQITRRIEPAQLINHGGILGAASLWKQHQTG